MRFKKKLVPISLVGVLVTTVCFHHKMILTPMTLIRYISFRIEIIGPVTFDKTLHRFPLLHSHFTTITAA